MPAAQAQSQIAPQNVTFFWPAPTNYPGWQTNITWKFYTATDLSTPRSNWVAQVVSPTLGTNNGIIWFSNVVSLLPGQYFVGLGSSNFWELPFTNAVALPQVPPQISLGAKPGP